MSYGEIIRQAVLPFQFKAHPLEVAGRLLEGRRLHLDIVGLHHGIVFDMNVARGLAHHLLSGPGFLGHENQHIALDLGNAAQPIALLLWPAR